MSARDELAKHLADLWPVSTGDLREADAILSALSAMPLASRLALARALVPGWAVEEGWQPIATAPTNGTWVWCWHAEQRWKRIGMRSKASGPRWYYSGTGFNAQYADDAPTHWRPLPADPVAEEPPHGP